MSAFLIVVIGLGTVVFGATLADQIYNHVRNQFFGEIQ